MALTEKDVERLAVLARINLTAEEKETFARQMSSILDSAAVLDELSTDGIEPLIYVLSQHNVMRDDKVRPSLTTDEALANAPLKEDAMFKVPRLI